jgi:hypothetical protein
MAMPGGQVQVFPNSSYEVTSSSSQPNFTTSLQSFQQKLSHRNIYNRDAVHDVGAPLTWGGEFCRGTVCRSNQAALPR